MPQYVFNSSHIGFCITDCRMCHQYFCRYEKNSGTKRICLVDSDTFRNKDLNEDY